MIVVQEDILQSRWQLFELNGRDFRLDLLLQVLKFCLFVTPQNPQSPWDATKNQKQSLN
jgi:hypothetical protein